MRFQVLSLALLSGLKIQCCLSDINIMNIFSGQSPKTIEIKAKINPWDLIKRKSFCTAKETKKKTKRQLTEWEKIVSNDATDKGLTAKTYKQLTPLNSKKSQEPNGKMGKRPEQTFLQRRYTDGKQTHEKMFNIADYKRNANQNYREIPPHTSQNGHH